MAFCKHCGSEIKEDAKFCPSCGKPIQEHDMPATPQPQTQQQTAQQAIPKKKKTKASTWGCLIFIFIGVFIVMITMVCNSCEEKKMNKMVKVKEVTGAKCIGCEEIFSAETTEVEKKYSVVRDKKIIYAYRDTVCAKCEEKIAREATELFNEGKVAYNSGNFQEAKNKFTAAKQKGHKQATDWINKAQEKIDSTKKKEEAEAKSKARKSYGTLARNSFLDSGMDIKVSVHGPNNTYLTLTYVLMGDVWVHNFEKSPMFKEIRDMGFDRIYYKDGYKFSKYTYWK